MLHGRLCTNLSSSSRRTLSHCKANPQIQGKKLILDILIEGYLLVGTDVQQRTAVLWST